METDPAPEGQPTAVEQPASAPSPEEIRSQLEIRMRSGASWFYWIAALSLVNSVAALGGVSWAFVIGLALTQVIDAFAKNITAEAGNFVLYLAFGLDVMMASVFALFGRYAKRGSRLVFIAGMLLYAGDGLIVLLLQDWVGVGFHAFALYCIYIGFKACREMNALDHEAARRDLAAGATLG